MQLHNLDQIARIIENCISTPQQISQNPRLVAIFAYYGFIPIDEIIAVISSVNPNFATVSTESAATACRMSYALSRQLTVSQQQVPGLILPYQISPTALELSGVPHRCSKEKLKVFVSGLCGTSDFDVEKLNNSARNIFLVTFRSIEHSMFLWRALHYVPLDGSFIEAAAHIIIKPLPLIESSYDESQLTQTQQQRYRKRTSSVNGRSSPTPQAERKVQQPSFNITRRKDYIKAAPSLKISIEKIQPRGIVITK